MTTFLPDRSRSEGCLLRFLFPAVCALAVSASVAATPRAFAQDGSEGGSIGGSIAGPPAAHKAPPAHRHSVRAAPTPRRIAREPQPERAQRRRSARQDGGGGGNFDGAWSVSAGGPCAAAGTNQVVISNGRISGQGGSGTVSRNGAVRTVGSVNGITVIGTGRISGQSASGSYRQSDGCVGTWSAYKL